MARSKIYFSFALLGVFLSLGYQNCAGRIYTSSELHNQDASSSMGYEDGMAYADGAIYTLVDAKVASECSRMQDEIRVMFGADCIGIDVNEDNNAAVTALNERLALLNEARADGETMCKLVNQSGRNQICKIPSVAYIVSSDKDGFVRQYYKMRKCTPNQRGSTKSCVKILEKEYTGQNMVITISDGELINYIEGTIKMDNTTLCVFENNVIERDSGIIHRSGLWDSLCRI